MMMDDTREQILAVLDDDDRKIFGLCDKVQEREDFLENVMLMSDESRMLLKSVLAKTKAERTKWADKVAHQLLILAPGNHRE